MDALNINFEKNFPDIINALVKVYGEQYEDIITKRFNNINYAMYNNYLGIENYYNYLVECKKNQLYLKFLEKVEININKFNINNYFETQNKKVNFLIDNYIGLYSLSNSFLEFEPVTGIKAFENVKKDVPHDLIIDNQLKFLNFYRGRKNKKLTIKTLDVFKQTEEYSLILIKIKEFLIIYKNIYIEFKEYLKTIKKYIDFVNEEKRRLKELKDLKRTEEIEKEFIYSSESFLKLTKKFNADDHTKECIFALIKEQRVCSASGYDEDNNNEFLPIIFYTIRKNDVGTSDYTFLHEVIHSIESEVNQNSYYRIGFDYLKDNKIAYNCYNNKIRKYERLNEVLTDIFAIEARKILHKKNIFFADLPENTIYDVEDYNTHHLLKDCIKPLLEKFRIQIIKARLLGNLNELYEIIGLDNYENLNDSINKIDFLLDNGLYEKLMENEQKDYLVIEYNSQIKRIEQIYIDLGIIDSKEIYKLVKHK